MSRPTFQPAYVAKFSAFLLLAGAVLALSAPPAVRGQPTSPKVPATQPKTGEVPDLRQRWEGESKFAPQNPILLFDLDGQVVVLTGRQKVEAVSFNARTGKAGHELPAQADATASNFRQLRQEKGVFLFQQGRSTIKELVTWDATTGKIGRLTFPTVATTGLQTLTNSPNGRYMAVGTPRRGKDKEIPETPFRVFDSKTGKAAVSLEWLHGNAAFTADSSRVLTVDATERFRWFKLPSGQADGEWTFDRPADDRPGKLLTVSADGGAILYAGAPPKETFGIHLLNGKTGELLHSFRGYSPEVGFLSPDGGSVVLVRSDAAGGFRAELLDARGTVLAKVQLPKRSQLGLLPAVAASWEARALAAYDGDAGKVAVYDMPGANVAVPRPVRDVSAVKNRAPIPGDAAVAKADAGIRQVLKDEYARKQPTERKALAQKLITLAAETPDDVAARYVMLRDAQELAVGVADAAIALQAIEGLAKWYQVEGAVQQLAALEKILATTSSLPTVKFIAEYAGPAADAAADADEFDEAVQFAQLAVNAVRKGKLGAAASDDADYRLTQTKKARDAFAAVRPALEKLKTTPDDPAANTTVGKYRCLVQNRWDDGLKFLAKCQDTALRTVAELDLTIPRTGVPEDAKVADAWWEYAQSATAADQWAVQTRSRYWYARCMPGLTGLNKARAETRLVFTAGGVEYRPGLVCELSAKQPTVLKGTKARLDPSVDFSGGEFAAAGKQTDLTLKWTGVLVPPQAGRYTITAQTSDPVRVRIDNKVVIDTISAKATKKEAQVTLGERAAPIVIEYSAPNTDRHKLKLMWTPPGRTDDQLVAAEYLFHDKRAESLLGK